MGVFWTFRDKNAKTLSSFSQHLIIIFIGSIISNIYREDVSTVSISWRFKQEFESFAFVPLNCWSDL
nr:hypothetical protein Iba_chr02bCG7740 [Ipomoea batatas]